MLSITMKLKRSKLTHVQTNELLKFFIAGSTARTAADLVGVNRNTAILFFRRIREKITEHQEKEFKHFYGEVEIDECYFRTRGKKNNYRRRKNMPKVPVFGILKRRGKVYTCIVKNVRKKTLLPIIKKHIQPHSVVYSDTLGSYHPLRKEGYRHLRVNHGTEYVRKKNKSHINGIENFWKQTRRHLQKFNGLPASSFHLFLKECEWRFNGGSPKELLSSLRKMLNEE